MTRVDPSPATLRWAAETAGSDVPARLVRQLAGGTHAVTHLVETARPARQMVLRRYPPGDTAAAREAAILTALDGMDGWAPELIGADATGRRTGAPSVLITRLPGRADLSVPPAQAAEQLGRALTRVHAVPLDRFRRLRDGLAAVSPPATAPPTTAPPTTAPPTTAPPTTAPPTTAPPSAAPPTTAQPGAAPPATARPSTAPAAGVLTADGDRLSAGESVLTHFDYWSGNVLWDGRTITGIVDWSGASRAPRGFDVSWCRLDLVLLHGEPAADIFLAAYEQAARTTVPDVALWDLFALTNAHHTVETWHPNYAGLGRDDLTPAELRSRHTAWTRTRLSRYQQGQAR
ncbi:phosphotransferase family protein [Paractinoplanes atraurantiacus]|uniref:Ser/Thr protein kinase RdoA involved in Cpx stress response, MazF antagonist n=1 Tax=Paractinoplanes atraurantiacus TaxID=1036182 RepID=A0A285IH82_9ACTN|nr:aminoglycoside phosphotransferase family protein [Actinoplanes atraurantiacus]SNY47147.1 Ser/Thr protein kinase RdoA involved in Cpx stress response, MazF antagonist [Actinoplanes atraurantiacus]